MTRWLAEVTVDWGDERLAVHHVADGGCLQDAASEGRLPFALVVESCGARAAVTVGGATFWASEQSPVVHEEGGLRVTVAVTTSEDPVPAERWRPAFGTFGAAAVLWALAVTRIVASPAVGGTHAIDVSHPLVARYIASRIEVDPALLSPTPSATTPSADEVASAVEAALHPPRIAAALPSEPAAEQLPPVPEAGERTPPPVEESVATLTARGATTASGRSGSTTEAAPSEPEVVSVAVGGSSEALPPVAETPSAGVLAMRENLAMLARCHDAFVGAERERCLADARRGIRTVPRDPNAEPGMGSPLVPGPTVAFTIDVQRRDGRRTTHSGGVFAVQP